MRKPQRAPRPRGRHHRAAYLLSDRAMKTKDVGTGRGGRPLAGAPRRGPVGPAAEKTARRETRRNRRAEGSAECEVLGVNLLVGEPEVTKGEHNPVRQADGAADEDIPVGDVGH